MQNGDISFPLPTEECVLLTCLLPYISTLCTYFLNRYAVTQIAGNAEYTRTEVQRTKLYMLNFSTLKTAGF